MLVGGLGTRLRAEVPDLPKPLAPVAGRPFLAYILDNLAHGGIRRVVLATGYLSELVERAVGKRWQSMDICYSREPVAMGTGGAVALARQQLHSDAVHLCNGDTFLRYEPARLQDCAQRQGLELAVALAWVDDVGRYGAVDLCGERVTGFREKGGTAPGYINAGSYFLGRAVLEALPAGRAFSFEIEVLQPAASAQGIAGWTQTADFIDIGVPEDYRRAQALFQGDGRD